MMTPQETFMYSLLAMSVFKLLINPYLPSKLDFSFLIDDIKLVLNSLIKIIQYVGEHRYFKPTWMGILIIYMICNLIISCMGYTMNVLEGENIYIALYKPILVMSFASLGFYFNVKLMKM